MNNDLNTVLEGMHNDKVAVLRDQLAAIDAQEQERLRIGNEIENGIRSDIGEVRCEELRVTPDEGYPDAERLARTGFLTKRLDLIDRLRAENRACWNDYQKLEEERREIQRELTTLERRDAT
jgi:hypothetical protein